MVALTNMVTGDNYIKETTGGGNPFRAYVNTTQLPQIATAGFPWESALMLEVHTLGGQLVDPKNCQLTSHSFQHANQAGILNLQLQNTNPDLTFDIKVTLPDGNTIADLDLTITNRGTTTHDIMPAFPYFTGLGLGSDRGTNLAVRTGGFGIPGVKAWVTGTPNVESGGVYAKQISTQWQAIYEPNLNEGFGMIVMDPNLENKIIHRFPPSGMSVLYYIKQTLAQNDQIVCPTARLMAHKGTWRPVARQYGKWFHEAFDVRQPAEWFDKIDTYSGSSLPATPIPWTSMPTWYLHHDGDAGEHAGWPEDDWYYPRADYGTPEEMRQGVAATKEIGRFVILYILGVTRNIDSVLWDTYNITDFAVQNANGTYEMIDGPNYMMCSGYEPWQDYLAMICKRAIEETGANGFRLDQVGAVPGPCYNPVHNHETPFDACKWQTQLLSKIRTATDEIDPNVLILTEGSSDFFSIYTNGSLPMMCTGYDQSPMILAIPEFRAFAHHAGQAEVALSGWVSSGRYALRGYGWLGIDEPDYLVSPGPLLKWHIMRSTFDKAVWQGDITDIDPYAPEDPRWVGRIWKSEKYWLMVGGHFDASSLNSPTRIKLPELPNNVRSAYEFNTETMAMKQAPLVRGTDGIYIIVQNSFSAILLPKPNCPPLIMIDGELQRPARGQTITLTLQSYAPWGGTSNPTVNVEIPTLQITPPQLTLPGTVQVTVPPDTIIGGAGLSNFPLKITGQALPIKRWFQVLQ